MNARLRWPKADYRMLDACGRAAQRLTRCAHRACRSKLSAHRPDTCEPGIAPTPPSPPASLPDRERAAGEAWGGMPAKSNPLNPTALWLLLCGFAWFGYTVNLPTQPGELARAEAALGIRIEQLALAAEGYALEIHYRVIDRLKAPDLGASGVPAYLIREPRTTQLDALILPLRSPASSRQPNDGHHVAAFENPGQTIKRGDRVTLVLGSLRIGGLPVR